MSLERVAATWTAALGPQLAAPLTAEQVAALMKIARGTLKLVPILGARTQLAPDHFHYQPPTPAPVESPTEDAWDAPPVPAAGPGSVEEPPAAPPAYPRHPRRPLLSHLRGSRRSQTIGCGTTSRAPSW